MDKVQYLSQARHLNRRINIKLERYEELKALAEKSTKVLTGMPRGGNSKADDTIAKIVDLSIELNEEIDRLVDLEKEINGVIKALPTVNQQMVLELYYILFNSWEEVANKMGYDKRQVYRIHDEALRNIVIPERCH